MTTSPVTWNIVQLERHLPDGETCPDGSVYTIHWSASLEEDNETANAYGSVGLGAPDPDDFVPYSELTQDQVLQWLFETLGPDQIITIQENLHQQIQDKIAPTSATGIPWA